MAKSYTTHALERTSPKGLAHKFVGRCVLCGKEGLEPIAALEECPNPEGLSGVQVMLKIIDAEERGAARAAGTPFGRESSGV